MSPLEAERGCGYRTVGGLYLVGEGITLPCDRLPMKLEECPVCGSIPHFIRSVQKIDPLALWGPHDKKECQCPQICPLCNPETKPLDIPNYLMWVGSEYTTRSFIKEATKMGVSKKINGLPKDLVIGKSWVYLARKDMIQEKVTAYHPKKPKKTDAVFYAFVPQRVEYLMERKEKGKFTADELAEIKECAKRNITIIWVDRTPDNEVHFSKRKGKRRVIPKSKKNKHKPMDLSKLLKDK